MGHPFSTVLANRSIGIDFVADSLVVVDTFSYRCRSNGSFPCDGEGNIILAIASNWLQRESITKCKLGGKFHQLLYLRQQHLLLSFRCECGNCICCWIPLDTICDPK